jgi:hypothetical protein
MEKTKPKVYALFLEYRWSSLSIRMWKSIIPSDNDPSLDYQELDKFLADANTVLEFYVNPYYSSVFQIINTLTDKLDLSACDVKILLSSEHEQCKVIAKGMAAYDEKEWSGRSV